MNVKFPLWWCRDHGKLFWFTADVLLGVVVHYWCKSSVNKKVERIIFLVLWPQVICCFKKTFMQHLHLLIFWPYVFPNLIYFYDGLNSKIQCRSFSDRICCLDSQWKHRSLVITYFGCSANIHISCLYSCIDGGVVNSAPQLASPPAGLRNWTSVFFFPLTPGGIQQAKQLLDRPILEILRL